MMDKKFSVIIPCYNAEKFIISALNSLEEQTYKNFEVVIINDGSIDSTEQLILQYNSKFGLNLKYEYKENKGVSAARNLGISISQGEYIVFLDADDFLLPNCLELFYNLFSVEKPDLIIAKYARSVQDSTIYSNNITYKKVNKFQLFDIYNNHKRNSVAFASCAYKKEIIEKNHIFFDEAINYGEDGDFILRYIFHCENGGINTSAVAYFYTINYSSSTFNYDYTITQAIIASKQIASYWKKDPKMTMYKLNYMVHRTVWSIAKCLAIASDDLWEKFLTEYQVKESMLYIVKYSDECAVRIAALVFLLSKTMFRKLVRVIKNVTEKFGYHIVVGNETKL